jgi:hypothetical protein
MKLKPLLIYRMENPQALKNIIKSLLPVIWKSHRMTRITRQIFCDWFVEYFLPEIKKQSAEENLDFRIPLILHTASAHVLEYVSLFHNVKIIYMPPRTPPVMQLMDYFNNITCSKLV